MKTKAERLGKLFSTHFEWIFFAIALTVMALMDPSTEAASWCLYDRIGINFCPGEGLGHSIAYFFRGDFMNAWQAHPAGPFAVLILIGRIAFLLRNIFNVTNT